MLRQTACLVFNLRDLDEEIEVPVASAAATAPAMTRRSIPAERRSAHDTAQRPRRRADQPPLCEDPAQQDDEVR